MAKYSEEEMKSLRARWENKDNIINEMISILKGKRKVKTEEEAVNRLIEANELLKANIGDYLEEEIKIPIFVEIFNVHSLDLRGIKLVEKDCGEIFLVGARLEGAYLRMAWLEGADLSVARLEGAGLLRARLEGAYLTGARLERADLRWARLEGADLTEADLAGTDLSWADFRNANLSSVSWHKGLKLVWRGVFPRLEYLNKPVSVEGASIAGASFANSRHFERFIRDEQFIQELEATAKTNKSLRWILRLWKWSSDYGRSFFRWAFISVVIAVIFGFVFADYYIPFWVPDIFADIISIFAPELNIAKDTADTWYSPYYFSVVTFTTLGFGDVTPLNFAGQVWITLEVILGYVMLGGLISILANKLARRA
ncbi:MAG: pentapeptide repeat-containing protein [candidate division Zixibacteria bacterium]|nr:pentapeptide repeat-containing protein [Candidatus Tariuqbacter arcticus]